jgi:hypothetical protein
MKFFNTAGPCKPEMHYMLPAANRLPELRRLIDQQLYFVIHAPRQTSKTTMMLELARELTQAGRYTALLVSMEVGAAFNYLTQGQPYLANALAKVAVEELQPDVTQPVTVTEIERAKEVLIERQETHLDSLVERLREERIRHIIEPILSGRQEISSLPPDDVRFVTDLGLVRRANGGGLVIANPIYREVIPTMLAYVTRAFLPQIAPTWLNPDKLLDAFPAFWRQHGQPLLKSVHYHEIAPHIVLMAFLHRVVNGGGTLEREYAIGTRRMDVCVRYGAVILGMELKVWRDGERDPLNERLEQLDQYLNGLGLATGWLVIFDQRSGLPDISERTSTETAASPAGRAITVIRG